MATLGEVEIALLKAEMVRINSRLNDLETKSIATTAILNKWGGGIAVAIILTTALWAVIIGLGPNIKKIFGGMG